MKYLKPHPILESRYSEFKEIISNLEDICQEFKDANCTCRIEPSNDIRIKVMALQNRGDVFEDINLPFYVEIDIDRRIITPDSNRSGFGPLPNWFIDTCRRIEDYMSSEGFKTLPSIRYGTDWENFDTLDELAVQESLIYKVKLAFEPVSRSLVEAISNRDLELDIRDMFLELEEDYGYQVEVSMRPSGVSMFCVGVSRDELFQWSDVKDYFERAKGYVEDNNWTLTKSVVCYYPQGAFNDKVKVLNRLKTKEFSGSNWNYFREFITEQSFIDNNMINEIALIFDPKKR